MESVLPKRVCWARIEVQFVILFFITIFSCLITKAGKDGVLLGKCAKIMLQTPCVKVRPFTKTEFTCTYCTILQCGGMPVK